MENDGMASELAQKSYDEDFSHANIPMTNCLVV